MTIIVFLVDTSASMNQRADLGGRPSILDVAKGAVETFVKVRQRSLESRGDRYMLLTFEDPPSNIKAGWKENLSTFMNELKNLQCLSLTTMGDALKHVFDVLNLNRMQTGIDTYGQGRCPFFLEPSVILVITDGGKLSCPTGVTDDFNLPMHTLIPGSGLTREPFRWDQRLFALVLRLSGTPANERDIGLVPSDDSPIDAMCEVTGGRSYCITSQRMMMQCIDSLVQKVQSGVVINFEKMGPDPISESRPDDISESTNLLGSEAESNDIIELKNIQNTSNTSSILNSTAWQSCRKMIYVPRSAQKGFAVGFWPIPESFWPDISISELPPRTAHPNVKFTCLNQDPMVIENLPFDKYELEPSPLTQYILARKQPTTCWQVFVPNSYKNSDVGHPFGYLKASTNLTCVNLFVMPYNYPVLLPLLDDLFKIHRLKPTNEWTQLFRNYMRTMPSYYIGPLRRALIRMGAPNSLAQTLMPDILDTSLSYSVLNYIKKLKNLAKIEFDRLCTDVLTRQNAALKCPTSSSASSSGVRVSPRTVFKRDFVTQPHLNNKFIPLREQLNEYGGFIVGLPTNKTNTNIKSYRNPFDIHRSNLLDQVVRMRANFLQSSSRMKLVDDDVTHSLPINQMGNYQEYLKRVPAPLREIESAPVRQHMFGNPFKIDKRMMVDEADIDLVSGGTTGNNSTSLRGIKRANSPSVQDNKLPQKRRPGPIPKDKTIKRPSKALLIPEPFEPITPVGEKETTPEKQKEPPATVTNWTPVNGKPMFQTDNVEEKQESKEPIIENGLPPPQPSDSFDLYRPLTLSTPSNIEFYHYEGPLYPEDVKVPVRTPKPNVIEIEQPEFEECKEVAEVYQEEVAKTVTEEELLEEQAYNVQIKKLLFIDVRKPGKNYDGLFKHIEMLRGEQHMKSAIIQQVYSEALRFKREKLAKEIQNFLTTSEISNT